MLVKEAYGDVIGPVLPCASREFKFLMRQKICYLEDRVSILNIRGVNSCSE